MWLVEDQHCYYVNNAEGTYNILEVSSGKKQIQQRPTAVHNWDRNYHKCEEPPDHQGAAVRGKARHEKMHTRTAHTDEAKNTFWEKGHRRAWWARPLHLLFLRCHHIKRGGCVSVGKNQTERFLANNKHSSSNYMNISRSSKANESNNNKIQSLEF